MTDQNNPDGGPTQVSDSEHYRKVLDEAKNFGKIIDKSTGDGDPVLPLPAGVRGEIKQSTEASMPGIVKSHPAELSSVNGGQEVKEAGPGSDSEYFRKALAEAKHFGQMVSKPTGDGDPVPPLPESKPGVFKQALAKVSAAMWQWVEWQDGKEATELLKQSSDAYQHGNIREGIGLGIAGNKEAVEHVVAGIKGLVSGGEHHPALEAAPPAPLPGGVVRTTRNR
jgi:hypothetical protein